ncbi:MAG: SIS domain-containing protein [Candidatus Cloacimonetes bacterium]|nr:SIS domain-containing protein [Candidatus Cloacimonadota bacterium]
MKDSVFIAEYFQKYFNALKHFDVSSEMIQMKEILINANKNNNKIIFAGNGASAAIASHAALDFTKQGKIRSICFNDASFITAFANDFGYDKWIEKAIECHCKKNDVAVLISSSGKSPNVVNAARYSKEIGMKVITFSGFLNNNPLKIYGDVNFWLDSKAYNIIENIHQIWLMAVCDLIIGKAEYSVS